MGGKLSISASRLDFAISICSQAREMSIHEPVPGFPNLSVAMSAEGEEKKAEAPVKVV